jgi:hypothetical protein
MSDIDAEDVVEAVAPSEANAAQTRTVAVSPAFRDGFTPEKVTRMTFRNRSGNGVTLNRISTRGNEDSLRISRRFTFPSQRDTTGLLGHSAEQKAVAAHIVR